MTDEERKKNMDPAWKPVHNAEIELRISVYRETIEFLQRRIAELEAEKVS